MYKCNTEEGYDILCSSFSTPLEKQSCFYRNYHYNIRQRKFDFIEFVPIDSFDVATQMSPETEAYYLWSWNDDLNKYVLTSESDEYLGTSDTDSTPLPKTEFSEGDIVYMYNGGKYNASFTVSFTKDSAALEDRIYLGIKELPVLCVPFDWNSEINAYYNESIYQMPLVSKDGSLINKDFDFSSNISCGVAYPSEGSGSISSNGVTVGFYVSGGKGVIYYMKDLNNNEAYYDFKHIKFRGSDGVYRYTFYNGTNDASDYTTCFGNCIKPSTHIYNKFTLNKVCIGPYSGIVENGFPSNITVSGDVYYKVFDRPKSNSYIGLNSKGEVIITNIYDDNANDNIELLKQEIINNEEVTAAALNDLNSRIQDGAASFNSDKEDLISKALNDLNSRIGANDDVVTLYLDPTSKICVVSGQLIQGKECKLNVKGTLYYRGLNISSLLTTTINTAQDAVANLLAGTFSSSSRISIPVLEKYCNVHIKAILEIRLYDCFFDAIIHETITNYGDVLQVSYTKLDACKSQDSIIDSKI